MPKKAHRGREYDRADEQRPRRGNHKDTRRWCKGVPGREHVTEVRHYHNNPRLNFFVDYCLVCHKSMHLREGPPPHG